MAAEALLRVTDVGIERGYRRLLTGVAFEVGPGQIWQLSGANGSGKTSLLRAVAGLAHAGVTGSIERTDSCLFQGHANALKPLLSATENLSWHPSGGIDCSDEAIEQALAAVGLAGLEGLPVGNLSAGQQRRVGLARLWLAKSALWLLDEPFTALDTQGVAMLSTRLDQHLEQGGGVVFSSHQPMALNRTVAVLALDDYAA